MKQALLGTGNTMVNKHDICPQGTYLLVEGTQQIDEQTKPGEEILPLIITG
jgi:hypothetical protein